MKIANKKHTTIKRTLLASILVLLLSIGGYTLYASTQKLWPYKTVNTVDQTKPDKPLKDDDKPDDPSDENVDAGTDTSTDQPVINPPISNPPTVSDPYPIENEHYKIAQTSENSFTITLYPIANNPNYSDYNAQLKAYKNEALSYLTQRYGSVNSLNITWNPPDAANI